MSSQRKLQRRSQVSRVGSVLAQTQQALSSLQGARLDQVPAVVQQLQEQTQRVTALADALADDYETLLAELEIQRDVTVRLFSVAETDPEMTLDQWRELENKARVHIIEERERKKDAESPIPKET